MIFLAAGALLVIRLAIFLYEAFIEWISGDSSAGWILGIAMITFIVFGVIVGGCA